MARIAGINLPAKKQIAVALTYIYGIGPSRAREILERTGVAPNTKVMDLTEQDVTALRREVESYLVEGDLRRQVGLPVRGQKTRTNARTWKGPRPAKAGKRK